MKQKLKRFMAGFMAMLTLVGTLFTNGTTAFAASPQANIAFWNASVKNGKYCVLECVSQKFRRSK